MHVGGGPDAQVKDQMINGDPGFNSSSAAHGRFKPQSFTR